MLCCNFRFRTLVYLPNFYKFPSILTLPPCLWVSKTCCFVRKPTLNSHTSIVSTLTTLDSLSISPTNPQYTFSVTLFCHINPSNRLNVILSMLHLWDAKCYICDTNNAESGYVYRRIVIKYTDVSHDT